MIFQKCTKTVQNYKICLDGVKVIFVSENEELMVQNLSEFTIKIANIEKDPCLNTMMNPCSKIQNMSVLFPTFWFLN